MQRFSIDDGLNKSCLGLKHCPDESVDGAGSHEVGDVNTSLLTDSVGPVFCLPVVGRHPIQIVENHKPTCGQVDAHAAGDQIRHEDPYLRVCLEAVDKLLPLARRGLSRLQHGLLSKFVGDPLERLVERGEYNHFFSLSDRPLDEIDRRLDLGLG